MKAKIPKRIKNGIKNGNKNERKMEREKLQESWEKVFPDAAALEREVKRRWRLSYFDFLKLMEGKVHESRNIKIVGIMILFFQTAVLMCQLWLSVWLLRLIGFL